LLELFDESALIERKQDDSERFVDASAKIRNFIGVGRLRNLGRFVDVGRFLGTDRPIDPDDGGDDKEFLDEEK
jgi:hypothetical protein